MSLFDKKSLQKQLKESAYTITFVKENGELRVMRCTLMPKDLPTAPLKEEDEKTRKENPDVLNVWDLDKNGWRSMRVENIKEVKKEGIETNAIEKE